MIRDLIPPKARLWVYAALSVVSALDVADVMPHGPAGKIAKGAAVLGFGLAAGNVQAKS